MNHLSRRKTIIKIILHLLTILCMIVIFYFSAQNADYSSETSGEFIYSVGKIFFKDFRVMSERQQASLIESYQYLVRKFAHIVIYAFLGMLTAATMLTYPMKTKNRIVCAFVISFLYAVSDELHQMFVPGRGPMFSDVLIDTVSASAGIAIIIGGGILIMRFSRRKRQGVK